MPHISVAMQGSLRRSIGDILVEGLVGKRSITSDVTSVKDTFSSWDNCMAATYCKWPVIAAIIIAGLIILSIVTCIVRCACCGMSCCCTCFRCLSCCDCCGDSCEGKKNKPMKNVDDPYGPSKFANAPGGQGYQPPAPMPVMGGALPAPNRQEAPQYAQFEVGKNGLYVEPKPPASTLNEDALPPMPSWEGAAKKHVLTEEERAIELGELDPATGQKVPLMTSAAGTGISGPPSPANEFANNPYGARPGPGAGGSGYMNVPGDQYGQHNRGAFNTSPVSGMGGFQGGPNSGMGPPGRYGSPGPGNGGPGRYGSPGPQGPGRGGQDRYGYSGPQNMNRPGRGFGPPSPQDPYSPQGEYAPNDGFSGAGVGVYGRPPPQRQPSNEQHSNDSRQYRPQNAQYPNEPSRPMAGGRQYSDRSQRPVGPGYPMDDDYQQQGRSRDPPRGPGGPQRLASPPLSNNSGFDFGGAYGSSQNNEPQELESIPSPALPPQGYGEQGARRRNNPPQELDSSPQQNTYDQGGVRRKPTAPPQESGYGGFGNGSTAPPSYASRSPPIQEPTYPGYRPYSPASGATNRGGSSRGGREPQAWDPVRQ